MGANGPIVLKASGWPWGKSNMYDITNILYQPRLETIFPEPAKWVLSGLAHLLSYPVLSLSQVDILCHRMYFLMKISNLYAKKMNYPRCPR